MAYPTDQLVIDTPEQIALELPLAGIGSRSLALVVDTLLQMLLGLVLGLAALGVALVGGMRVFESAFGVLGAFAPAVLVFLAFCVYWGYFALFESLWKGQTPGKRVAGIRVIKDSGRPITAFESIGRNLMRAVDGLPGMYAVGIVSMFVSRQNRRLGDYVAGTVVVHDHDGEARPYLEERPAASDLLPGAVKITADELILIETYLQRRYDYDFEARTRTAETIAERIRARLELPRESVGNPDTFLETVARQTRDAARFR
jgi:uncharacterized RDD family membrane protein YckC